MIPLGLLGLEGIPRGCAVLVTHIDSCWGVGVDHGSLSLVGSEREIAVNKSLSGRVCVSIRFKISVRLAMCGANTRDMMAFMGPRGAVVWRRYFVTV
jgi:hypothetical protein